VVAAVGGAEPVARVSLLEPVVLDPARGRRGRWWFIVVPLAAIVLLAGVAWRLAPAGDETVPGLPQLSPPVALPELASASPTPGKASATPSASASAAAAASRRATATPTAQPTGSAGPGILGSSGPPAPPPATGRPIRGIGNRCLEAVGSGAPAQVAVQLAACSGGPDQQWSSPGDSTFRALGTCLGVSGGGSANRTPVILYGCNGSAAQDWFVRADGTWLNPAAGRCLDTENGSAAPGTRLVIFDCTGAGTQRWTFG
jgi:hypothetical protein